MRSIGHLKNEASARTFGDYLTSVDVRNLVESEADGTWAVWVHDEEQISTGQAALAQFQQNPSDARFRGVKEKAAAVANKERADLKAVNKRVITSDAIWARGAFGPLTIILIGVSVLVTLTGFPIIGNYTPIWPREFNWLAISEYAPSALLPEVRHGQVWRLVTPIFFHFGILHILFNMLMLRDIGGILEVRLGTAKYALMVLIMGIASNLGQFLLSGPEFGGMSGVLYGLFGFLWIRSRVDPNSGLFISGQSVIYLVAWYFLCLFGVIGNVANGTHTVGLLVGMAWGALPLLTGRRS